MPKKARRDRRSGRVSAPAPEKGRIEKEFDPVAAFGSLSAAPSPPPWPPSGLFSLPLSPSSSVGPASGPQREPPVLPISRPQGERPPPPISGASHPWLAPPRPLPGPTTRQLSQSRPTITPTAVPRQITRLPAPEYAAAPCRVPTRPVKPSILRNETFKGRIKIVTRKPPKE